MSSKEEKDSGWLIPGCDLQNLRGLCGNNTLVFFFLTKIFSSHFFSLRIWTISGVMKTRRSLGDVASHQLMLANLCVCESVCVEARTCLLYFSSFSSQKPWKLCFFFFILHLTDEKIESQTDYWLCPRLHSLYVNLRLVFEECAGLLG